MAANPKPPMESSSGHSHVYHAKAHVLTGELHHPIKQPIEHYGEVVLEKTTSDTHIAQRVHETSIEGLISFRSGHTRVIGTLVENKKDIFGADHAAHVTLATAVVEGFNVLDILTADRIVAQVSTEHPLKQGSVPKVTLLGTRFENLRIAGYPVEVKLDLEICGDKPGGDSPYLTEKAFLGRVERQLKSPKGVPKGLAKHFNDRLTSIDMLKKHANGRAKAKQNGYPKVQCSIVKSIGPIPIPGVKTFGNVIFIPNFGRVALGELEVGMERVSGNGFSQKGEPQYSHYFTLNMLDMTLGCPVGGNGKGPGVSSNGQNGPG
ncbi:MAG TPA: hypothetical protein VMI10_12000 [Terriglobales bacterium]|nr:hypothetical protein [Terriglobales bacterium]